MDFTFAEEHIEELWDLYLSRGRSAVAERCKVRYNSVGHILKHLGFYERGRQAELADAVRKRPHGRNPFTVENSEKYYLLGYILGDGSVYNKHGKYCLKIASKDKDHMLKLGSLFQIEPKFSNSVWNINSNDYSVGQFLFTIGIVPNKSVVGVTPFEVPLEYKEAFVCGLLDSDGCIRIKNGKLLAEWWGHESYMPWIQTLIPNSRIYRRKQDNLVEVYLAKQEHCLAYLKEMYQKTPIRLERKYVRYEDFIRSKGV